MAPGRSRRAAGRSRRAGLKELPSPYGGQRPTTVVATAAADAITSRTRRDFPIPGGPSSVTRWHSASRVAPSSAERSRSCSSERPTNGVAEICRWASAPGCSPSSREAGTAVTSGSVRTSPSVSRRVSSPSRISPGAAAFCRRSATVITWPVANGSRREPAPTKASPELTAIPTSIAPTAPCSSTAARTARRASSSRVWVSPNTPTTAPPVNLSTTPPWRSSACAQASSTPCIDSGSSGSAEGVRSANTTLSSLRDGATGSGSAAGRGGATSSGGSSSGSWASTCCSSAAQLAAGLDPVLVGEQPARLAEDRQRVGLAAAAVEREHQRSARGARATDAGRAAAARHQLGVPARAPDRPRRAPRAPPAAAPPGARSRAARTARTPSRRAPAPPERERLAEQRGGMLGWPAGERLAPVARRVARSAPRRARRGARAGGSRAGVVTTCPRRRAPCAAARRAPARS